MAHEVEVGAMRIRFDDDGVVVQTIVGTFQAEGAAAFAQALREYRQSKPVRAVIVDVRGSHGADPKARKIIIETVKEDPYPVCFLGASFSMRALITLMLNAAKLLGYGQAYKFVNTEEDAWAWVKSLPARRL